jgi:hypothetical protein
LFLFMTPFLFLPFLFCLSILFPSFSFTSSSPFSASCLLLPYFVCCSFSFVLFFLSFFPTSFCIFN